MSTTLKTPRELVQQLFEGLPSRDADRFVAHLAPDAVFEMPFVIPGQPARLEGREQIRDYLADRWSAVSGVVVHEIRPTIHQTTDPQVLVAECDIDLTRPDGERSWVRSSVNVIHVRDGLISLFRDYMDTGRFITQALRAQQG